MPLDQTANFVRATLASAIAAGDSTIALADSGQLVDPANGEYNLVVWDPSSYPRPGQDPAVEIVRATALDSGPNTLTVDRGQEGTSAADHAVEAVLQLSPTAKMFSDIDAKTSALSADGQTFAGDAIDVPSASVGSLNTEEAGIDKFGTGARFTVFEHDSTYYAIDRSGNVVASDSTPDVASLIQTLNDSINPDGVSTDGKSYELTIDIQPKDTAYLWLSQVSIRNGTRFSLQSFGTQTAYFLHPSSADLLSDFLLFDGETEENTGGGYNNVAYRHNTVTIEGVRFLWEQEPSFNIVNLRQVNRAYINDLTGHYLEFDLSDPIKRDEDVPSIPQMSGSLLNVKNSHNEQWHVQNLHSFGARKAFRFSGDHLLAENISAFWANPDYAAKEGIIEIAGDNQNDHTLRNVFVMDSAGWVVLDERTSGAGPLVMDQILQEGSPPNGYHDQQSLFKPESGDEAIIIAPRQMATAGNVTTVAQADASNTIIIGHGDDVDGTSENNAATWFGYQGGTNYGVGTGPSIPPQNLSGQTGESDGEVRLDDGTNTAARATACSWDDDNGVWRPFNDPSTGSFT